MTDTKQGASDESRPSTEQPARTATAGAAPGQTSSVGPNGAEAAAAESGEEAGLRPVSADMQQFIGRQLRAVFDDVAKQPIPDRFLELIKQLDDKTGVRG